MAIDAQGNDLSAVAIPVTGSIGIAPGGTAYPTPVEGAALDLTLDPEYKKLGLVTSDGGPQWAWEADGDPIEFWQDGYSIPSGLANVTLVVTAAQTDDFVRSIIYGKEPDENGFLIVDGGGHSTKYVIFTEEAFKNGYVRRRVAPNAGVQSVEEAQSTRGEVYGYTITFKISSSPDLDNGHFGEWLIPPAVSGGGTGE